MGLMFSRSLSVSWPDWASVQATHLLDAAIHISLVWEPLTAALYFSPLHSSLLLCSALISSPLLSSCNLWSGFFFLLFSVPFTHSSFPSVILQSSLTLKTFSLWSWTHLDLVGVLSWTCTSHWPVLVQYLVPWYCDFELTTFGIELDSVLQISFWRDVVGVMLECSGCCWTLLCFGIYFIFLFSSSTFPPKVM